MIACNAQVGVNQSCPSNFMELHDYIYAKHRQSKTENLGNEKSTKSRSYILNMADTATSQSKPFIFISVILIILGSMINIQKIIE